MHFLYIVLLPDNRNMPWYLPDGNNGKWGDKNEQKEEG